MLSCFINLRLLARTELTLNKLYLIRLSSSPAIYCLFDNYCALLFDLDERICAEFHPKNLLAIPAEHELARTLQRPINVDQHPRMQIVSENII